MRDYLVIGDLNTRTTAAKADSDERSVIAIDTRTQAEQILGYHMTGTIDRIRDATIRANNVAELRAFYNRIGFGELLARGDDFVVFAAGNSELVIHRVADQPQGRYRTCVSGR